MDLVNTITLLLGPLVVPECRRAVGRGWLILFRTLAALALGGVGLFVLWLWWFLADTDDNFQPKELIRIGVLVLEVMALVVGLILTPAVLAGSLAGEKERGSLPLLLTTSATPREIILGRLSGKMSQVVMILLAGLPTLILLGRLHDLGWLPMLTLVALPLAVSFGAAGISMAASVLSRRGRDALMSVYLLLLLVLMSQLALPFVPTWLGLQFLSPLSQEVIVSLFWDGLLVPAWCTIAIWLVFGALGLIVAAWRLRPSCLGQIGAPSRRSQKGRSLWMPPVAERPMLWKELFIERSGTLGRFGAFVGILLVVYLGIGSLTLTGVLVGLRWTRPDNTWTSYCEALMGWLYAGFSAILIGFLIECALGLRAAVAISSERERNTWDGLLTSPLSGGEIVNGKLWGNLFALRWLLLASLVAWVAATAMGAMTVRELASSLALVLAVGLFLSAVGVRVSLATGTATRSMSITMGIWMLAGLALFVASWVISAIVSLFYLFSWWMAAQAGLLATTGGPWAPLSIFDLQTIVVVGLYLVATSLVASESRLRFDRIAGRMAGGEVQVAFDQIVHGQPLAPVRIDSLNAKTDRVKLLPLLPDLPVDRTAVFATSRTPDPDPS